MKVCVMFITVLYIVSIDASSVHENRMHAHSVEDGDESSKNVSLVQKTMLKKNHHPRYFGFKTYKGFILKENMSSSDEYSGEGEIAVPTDEYFSGERMYIGNYNDGSNTYSEMDEPDSGERNTTEENVPDKQTNSTPVTSLPTTVTKMLPTLRSSDRSVNKYCEESCSTVKPFPCHTHYCKQKISIALKKHCESECQSLFMFFKTFLHNLYA